MILFLDFDGVLHPEPAHAPPLTRHPKIRGAQRTAFGNTFAGLVGKLWVQNRHRLAALAASVAPRLRGLLQVNGSGRVRLRHAFDQFCQHLLDLHQPVDCVVHWHGRATGEYERGSHVVATQQEAQALTQHRIRHVVRVKPSDLGAPRRSGISTSAVERPAPPRTRVVSLTFHRRGR